MTSTATSLRPEVRLLVGVLCQLTVVALGLSAGAMLTEAVVLVDIWRAMPPADFLLWFAENETHLVAFYGPLQTATTLLVLLSAAVSTLTRRPGSVWWAVSALLSIGVLALFFLYFSAANASFARQTLALEAVPAELLRWGKWQWLRTAVGVAAFAAALRALLEPSHVRLG